VANVSIAVSTPQPVCVIFDGFEDGDYTSNPPWEVVNPVGEASVVADPVRPGNLALCGYGPHETDHSLSTDVTLPWRGFDLSGEFYATQSLYGSVFRVAGDNTLLSLYLISHSWSFAFGVGSWIDGVEEWHISDLTQGEVPLNTWLRVRLWHDPETMLVHLELRLATDDTLIIEDSFLPSVDLAARSPIQSVGIGLEETGWECIDNICLTTCGPDCNE
jgi:hypothetical protein